MTEQEWLVCEDPQRMLEMIRVTDEACQRHGAEPGKAVTFNGISYRYPLGSDRKLRLWVEACRAMIPNLTPSWDLSSREGLVGALRDWSLLGQYGNQFSLKVRAALLRDIIGNPFRPLPPLSSRGLVLWPLVATLGSSVADTAQSLAHATYDERLLDGTIDPHRLAILADALEEAGCVEESILRHLRGRDRCPNCWGPLATMETGCRRCNGTLHIHSGPHTRGCWALDFILGKE